MLLLRRLLVFYAVHPIFFLFCFARHTLLLLMRILLMVLFGRWKEATRCTYAYVTVEHHDVTVELVENDIASEAGWLDVCVCVRSRKGGGRRIFVMWSCLRYIFFFVVCSLRCVDTVYSCFHGATTDVCSQYSFVRFLFAAVLVIFTLYIVTILNSLISFYVPFFSSRIQNDTNFFMYMTSGIECSFSSIMFGRVACCYQALLYCCTL